MRTKPSLQLRSISEPVRRRSAPLYCLLLGALLLLGGCEVGGVLVPSGRDYLRSGLYTYDAWSRGGRRAWWGEVSLQVSFGGRIRGSYRLPRQCTDGYGYVVDCVGEVGGRIYEDGRVLFGFDEGWLRHEGEVDRYSEVYGYWDTRLLGGYSSGDFELIPY